MREVKLPSGAILKVAPSPFKDSKALYQALLKEGRGIQFSTKTELASVYKDIFCIGFSSEEVEKCLWACMKRCIYNDGKGDLKIDDSTFESIAARDDYMRVCLEVAKENVMPFIQSLYAEYQHIIATIENTPA